MAKDGLIHKGLLPNQRENMGMCYYPSNALLLHIWAGIGMSLQTTWAWHLLVVEIIIF